MKTSELTNIIAAILILFVISGLGPAIKGNWQALTHTAYYAVIIIAALIISRKIAANLLDSDVEHEIWKLYRYGYRPSWHFKKEVPGGVIAPLFFSVFSAGLVKLGTILTYEVKALKRRAARRFGFYSWKELTEFHNGLIGAAGILGVLIVSFVAYFPGLALLSKLSAFYALSNMIPYSKLDGAQIFAGSRVLYTVLLIIVLIFFGYAIILG